MDRKKNRKNKNTLGDLGQTGMMIMEDNIVLGERTLQQSMIPYPGGGDPSDDVIPDTGAIGSVDEEAGQFRSSAERSEIRDLPVGILRVDRKYQRNLDRAWVKEIADDLDPRLLGPVHVSYRDGCFWVIDGQHRKYAIEMKYNDPDQPVECIVHHGSSEKDEARLFILLNTKRKELSRGSKLKPQTFL